MRSPPNLLLQIHIPSAATSLGHFFLLVFVYLFKQAVGGNALFAIQKETSFFFFKYFITGRKKELGCVYFYNSFKILHAVSSARPFPTGMFSGAGAPCFIRGGCKRLRRRQRSASLLDSSFICPNDGGGVCTIQYAAADRAKAFEKPQSPRRRKNAFLPVI